MKTLVSLLAFFTFSAFASTGMPAWFYEINDGKKRKSSFVKVMLPLINEGNAKIKVERAFVESFFKKLVDFKKVTAHDLNTLANLAKKYKIKKLYNKQAYLKRINAIPTSLALAQAAIESAWGNSRFVKIANNIFGQWTYGKNGIVPENRDEGKTHKIRVFKTLQASVDAYMLNLNRNRAYRAFRDKRLGHGIQNFTGMHASDTMTNYSGIGTEYNALLKKIIKDNNFLAFEVRL